MAEDYDPSNFSEFYGKTFVTKHGSRYTITEDRRVSGRPAIEGAEVKYLAGISKKESLRIKIGRYLLDPEKLEKLMREHGQDPQEGLCLVISLTEKSAQETSRFGFVTSTIDRIE